MIFPSGILLLLVGCVVSDVIDLRQRCDVKSVTCTISNCIEDSKITNDSKNNLPFSEVVFKHCRLQSMPSALFTSVPKLKRLLMYKCGLRSLQQITFSAATNLRFLFLPSNRLTELPEKIFSNLSSMEEIRLANNHISYIHPKAFDGLKKIRLLDLNSNKLHELAVGVFENLTSLEHIDLSYNEIGAFDGKIFHKIPQLKTIMLNNNNFAVFEYDSLAHLPHLTMLDVSSNVIGSINLQSVDTLRAQNSQLQHCIINGSVIRARVSSNQLKSISIGDKGLVKEIDVHNNLFETLSDFQGMMNLQKLDISKNPIRNLNGTNTSQLLDLPSLQYLNVASGKLQNLAVENFILLDKLTHLDLANNSLQNLDARVFEPLVSLEKFYLEGNHLHWFNYDAFLLTQVNVREMGISDNEWSQALLKKMSDVLKANDIRLVVRVNPREAGELMSHQTTSHPHHTIHAKTLYHEESLASAHSHVNNRDVLIVVTLCIVFVILALQILRIFKEENWLTLFQQGVRRDVASTTLINEEESGPF